MKIATFNIQNLFHRDKNLLTKSRSTSITNWITELDTLMRKVFKSLPEHERLRELSFLLGFDNIHLKPYAVLRRKAGYLYMKGAMPFKQTKASYLTDWDGWVEIKTVPIRPTATDNKALVIADVNADILLLHEVEDRASLEEFNREVLPKYDCEPYAQTFVIQNNDMGGLETAILLREGYQLVSVKTHLIGGYSDQFQHLLEYEIKTPLLEKIWMLGIHLLPLEEGDKTIIRHSQFKNITKIYEALIAEGKTNIIIIGTLNVASYSALLTSFITENKLKDITKHLSFEVDCDEGVDATYFRLGAFRLGTNLVQNDYMLLSHTLFEKLADSGLNRKAIWPEKASQWKIYKSVTSKQNAASEHPVVWGRIEF